MVFRKVSCSQTSKTNSCSQALIRLLQAAFVLHCFNLPDKDYTQHVVVHTNCSYCLLMMYQDILTLISRVLLNVRSHMYAAILLYTFESMAMNFYIMQVLRMSNGNEVIKKNRMTMKHALMSSVTPMTGRA